MEIFNKYQFDDEIIGIVGSVIKRIPFIYEDSYNAILNKNFPIEVSLMLDDAGVTIHKDKIDLYDGLSVSENKSLSNLVQEVLTKKPIVKKHNVFQIGEKRYHFEKVDGDCVIATFFADENEVQGFLFFWDEGHCIKIEDLAVKDARRLKLI